MKIKSHTLLQSFGFAILGLWVVFKKERNFKIHCLAAILITIIGFLLNFNYLEWLIILLLISLVMMAEIFNSAIEGICDLIRDKLKLGYLETKDVRNFSAGAVFLTACFSFLIGLILIFKKIF